MTKHFLIGEIVNWAGESNQLPPGFVTVTVPIHVPSDVTPVAQIMYVGEAAAEAVSMALQWARDAERETVNELQAMLWRFAEVGRYVEVMDPDAVIDIDERVPDDTRLRVSDFTDALDLLIRRSANPPAPEVPSS